MDKNKRNFTAKKAALIGLFVALIWLGAIISIPIPPVPFTLQTLFVLMAGALLGGAEGAICVGIYIFMGLIGIPVFSGFSSGFSYVLNPKFGFLLGFIFSALITGMIIDKKKDASYKRIIVAVIFGTIVTYVFGITYFLFLKAFYLGGEIDIWNIFLSFWILFIPTDVIKGAIVVFNTKKLSPVLYR
ncbi:MAG: biotin transporter BioY [Clostridia bacterium]|nr:biotin transporter BioY [Clostridia bacterium]